MKPTQEAGMEVFYADAEEERLIPEGMGAIVWGVVVVTIYVFFGLGCLAGWCMRGCM